MVVILPTDKFPNILADEFIFAESATKVFPILTLLANKFPVIFPSALVIVSLIIAFNAYKFPDIFAVE